MAMLIVLEKNIPPLLLSAKTFFSFGLYSHTFWCLCVRVFCIENSLSFTEAKCFQLQKNVSEVLDYCRIPQHRYNSYLTNTVLILYISHFF